MSAYAFRPLTRDDLPMVAGWLRTPEVVRWWGDPDEQFERVAGDLDEPNLRQWVVSLDGQPFAYLQDWDPHAWPDHSLSSVPPGARALDPFIGRPEMLGRGHGSALVLAAAERLGAEGYADIFIDPDEANAAAVRAYGKAGFAPWGRHPYADGSADLLLRWDADRTA